MAYVTQKWKKSNVVQSNVAMVYSNDTSHARSFDPRIRIFGAISKKLLIILCSSLSCININLFECGVTHQSRHTLSLREIWGCVFVPKCVWLVLPRPSNYDCRSEMRKRQRSIMLFVQDAPSLLTSWKLDFSFSFRFHHKCQCDHSGTSGRSYLWSSLTPFAMLWH